ncbi:VanZ family protein [Roseateles oligotrophus]|uniref:VanZ family protein n=1 Tax=Roseateles oligotrophus TaxID=1769250 RepID=A0ABT2YC81_9BURK|nr:VanZ family protein [Roseateles oligotrophus]MCV2367645.1 VanZ family protein [Roseateles oligotrophus]
MLKPFIHALFTSQRGRSFWRATFFLLLVVISYLALAPTPPKGLSSGWDKLNHAMAFASLAFCGHWSLNHRRARWLALPLALLAYGGAIELLQLQIPGRDGEWLDLLADAIGISTGLCAAASLNAMNKA